MAFRTCQVYNAAVNPYPARIEELHLHLEAKFGQRDRQATEIILACLLPAYPWLIIETDYPLREFRNAWFSFAPNVRSLSGLRVLHNRKQDLVLTEWLKHEGAQFFVEPEWRRLALGSNRPMTPILYNELMGRCLRLRVDHPRSAMLPSREADERELRRLVSRVLDPSMRTECHPTLPSSTWYWCELLQKVMLRPGSWEHVTSGIYQISRNVASLHNDPSKPFDLYAAERVMRDSIHPTTYKILQLVGKEKKDILKSWEAYKNSGVGNTRTVTNEVLRLHNEGLIVTRSKTVHRGKHAHYPWKYEIADPAVTKLLDRNTRILVP
jgi:hypothetical protein